MREFEAPRFPISAVMCVGFGLAAAAYAIALVRAEPRVAAVGWVALIAGVALLTLGSSRRISLALIVVMALTLPIFIAKGFLIYRRAPDQFGEHLANFGIQLSIPVLVAAAILIVQLASAPRERIFTGFRIEPWSASGAAVCFAAGVLSLLNAYDVQLVAFELLRSLFLFLVTFAIANFDRRATKVYLGALAVTVLLEGLLALGQFAAGGTLGLAFLGEMATRAEQIDFVDIIRPTGTLGNANVLGGFFALTLPLLLGLAMTSERRAMRALCAIAFAIGLGGLITTLSRGSWLTLPMNLGMVILVVVGRRIFSLKAAAVGAVALIALIIAAAVVGPTIVHRFVADDAGSAQSRIPMLVATWSVIKQFPIFGVGLNNFADALVRHDQTGFVQVHLDGFDNVLIVHNLYAFVLAETGLVGLLAFLWYAGSVFVIAYLVLRQTKDPWERAVAVGVATGLFAQMAQGAWDIGFRVPIGAAGMVVAAQIGLIASLRLQRRRSVAATREQAPRPASAASRSPSLTRIVGAAIVAVLALTGSAAAATLTVGPTGIYPSLDRVPWRDMQPGDAIILQPGFVQNGSVTITAQGRADAPIRITAAPGPAPAIHGSVMLSHSAHVLLEGFKVENARDVGIGIIEGSEHITVRNMTVRRTGLGIWIAMGAGGSNVIADNESSGNSTMGIGIDNVANNPGEETVISGNRIFDNGHHGIDVTGSRFIVEHNTIFNNGRTQFGTSGIMLYAGGFRGAPRREGMGTHNIVRYNTISGQHDDKTVDGNGIEADLWANDNDISYNLVYGNDGSGIVAFGSARNRIFNNTVIGNYRDSGNTHPAWGEISVASGDSKDGDTVASDNIVKNNIVVSTHKSHALFIDSSAAHNGTQSGGNLLFRPGPGQLFSWAGESGTDMRRWNELAKSVPPDVNADPMFVNIDDRPNGFRLRPGSPAVGRGAEPVALEAGR